MVVCWWNQVSETYDLTNRWARTVDFTNKSWWATVVFTNKCPVGDSWSHQHVLRADSWFHQHVLPRRHLISPTRAPPETLLDLTNHLKGSSSSVDKSPVGDSWFHQHVLPRRHLISPTRAPPETLDLTNHLKAITICFTSKDTKFKYHQTHFTRSLKIWTFCELWWIDEAKSKTVQVLTSSKTRAGVDFIPKTH
jgi:transposase